MRRPLDQYFTPDLPTQALLRQFLQIQGTRFVDPCCGDQRMARALVAAGRCPAVRTNDADVRLEADTHLDACAPAVWASRPEWCVTNPPFDTAGDIAWTALENCSMGVAILVRCTWLEPCGPSPRAPRGDRRWLVRRPPTAVLVLPRVSFRADGNTDSAGVWWVVWGPVPRGVFVVDGLEQQGDLFAAPAGPEPVPAHHLGERAQEVTGLIKQLADATGVHYQAVNIAVRAAMRPAIPQAQEWRTVPVDVLPRVLGWLRERIDAAAQKPALKVEPKKPAPSGQGSLW